MSAYLESNAELEKNKVKCLLNDYPEGLKIMEEIYNEIKD